MIRRTVAVAITALALLTAGVAGAEPGHRPKGDVRVFAHVPAPGYPALSLVMPNHTVYVGTFENATASDSSPSKVFHYSATGRLLRTYVVRGQTPGKGHGVQVAQHDRRGRLYLLDQEPARVVRLDPRTGRQRTYATFADVPLCSSGSKPGTCSDTAVDNPPEPDYAAWLPDGSLLVTDYTQGLIWRVPPGGGKARIWLTDPHFDGIQFDTAGIVYLRHQHSLLVAVSGGGLTTGGDVATGKLYRLSLRRGSKPGKLTKLWESGPAQAPDGFAVARSGHIYLALVGPGANEVVELSARGKQLGVVPSSPIANAQQSVPFDEPSSVQFLGKDLIVTNDCYFDGEQSHMVLFDVYAGERGLPVYVPRRAGRR